MFGFKVRDLFQQYLSYFFVMVVSFFLSTIIARFLGPSDFGIYASALAAGSVLAIIFDFGFRHLIQREFARSSSRFSKIKSSLLGVALVYLCLSFSSVALITLLFFPSWLLEVLSISFCFATLTFNQQISAYFKGQNLFYKDALHVAGARSFSGLAIFGLLVLGVFSYEFIFLAWGGGNSFMEFDVQ